MRLLFMGTPDFALEPLKSLLGAGHDVVCVVTREDKASGRGYSMKMPPVKEFALERGIEVLQPSTLRSEELRDKLAAYEADFFIVVAYGRILPQEILDLPSLGCINIHASLLPAYRGAAPIQWAIIDGLEYSGISTMKMDSGLDTGDILRQYSLKIEENETAGTLFDKLAVLAGFAITDTLADYDNIVPRKQEDSLASYAGMITKDMGNLDFTRPRLELERLHRGLNPWPGCYSYLRNKSLKLWKLALVSEDFDLKYKKEHEESEAGELLILGNSLYISCADGFIEVLELQLEGKKRLPATEFLKGYKLSAKDRLCGERS